MANAYAAGNEVGMAWLYSIHIHVFITVVGIIGVIS